MCNFVRQKIETCSNDESLISGWRAPPPPPLRLSRAHFLFLSLCSRLLYTLFILFLSRLCFPTVTVGVTFTFRSVSLHLNAKK